MKWKMLLLAGLCPALAGYAQNDSTVKNQANPAGDTLRVGSMIIVRNGQSKDQENDELRVKSHHNFSSSNLTTNWFEVDLGFTNFNDMTNYASAATQSFAPGARQDWFHLRNGKSVVVDIWFFMQRLNLIRHVVNLKYGVGLELNNYRYADNIRFSKNPVGVYMDDINYRKNKLAADYLTIPLLLNFNFTPHRRDCFGLSIGASAGYLYSARQKLISQQTGKFKVHDDFNLRPWKISYIAEIQLAYLSLFGTYATQSIFQYGLVQTPYTVGVRLGNWW
jgi:hypothetical protein